MYGLEEAILNIHYGEMVALGRQQIVSAQYIQLAWPFATKLGPNDSSSRRSS